VKDVGQTGIHRFGNDPRCHLPDGRVGLDPAQILDAHAAGRGETAHVVADQVDDHDVLGAVFFRGREGVGAGVARCRAFHGLAAQACALAFDEKFGRAGQDGAPGVADEGAVADGLGRAQAAVEGRRVAEKLAAQRKGEVDLVAVAVGDVLADARDVFQVVVFADAGREAAGTADVRPGPARQPGVAGRVVQPFAVFEDPAGEQGAMIGGQQGQQVRLDGVAKFVGGGEGDPGTAAGGVFEALKTGLPSGGIGTHDFLAQAGEQPGAGLAGGVEVVVEKGEGEVGCFGGHAPEFTCSSARGVAAGRITPSPGLRGMAYSSGLPACSPRSYTTWARPTRSGSRGPMCSMSLLV
jgi:hypothetical protein